MDFLDAMDSTSAQLVSSFGNNRLNELRVQYAARHQSRSRNDLSGTGPSILVSGVAAFGGPLSNTSEAGFDFKQGIWQVVDNFTYIRANHSYKFGFDIQHIADTRTSAAAVPLHLSVHRRLQRRAQRPAPRSYTNVQQLLGDPNFEMSSNLTASSCRTTGGCRAT